MIKIRETLALRLGFVALALLGLVAILGLILFVSRQTEQQIAARLAQNEMANVVSKLEGLNNQQRLLEMSTLIASRHLASQIARGAEFSNQGGPQSTAQTPCATPERDRRVIAAKFSPDQLPGGPETAVSGTPLDWRRILPKAGKVQTIVIPAQSACNAQQVSAQAMVIQIGKTLIVTGWMTEPMPQLARRYWLQASLAFGLLVSIGIGVALLMERRADAQMRHLTFVLRQVGQGNFDARPQLNERAGEYRLLAKAITAMTQQLKDIQIGLNSLMDRTAHDLRTPLSRAIARINGVIATQPDPAHASELQSVEADLRDLSSRFGAMLALREAATLDQDLGEQLDLAQIAAMAGEFYQDLDIAQGKTIELNLKPAWVCAQKGLIQNAIANLLDNALRFTPIGGTIMISTFSKNNMTSLAIRDTGPGIERSLLPNVFEAGVTSRARHGGYGLGLTTVREVARKHKGDITLQNQSDPIGLLATFSLPSAKCASSDK